MYTVGATIGMITDSALVVTVVVMEGVALDGVVTVVMVLPIVVVAVVEVIRTVVESISIQVNIITYALVSSTYLSQLCNFDHQHKLSGLLLYIDVTVLYATMLNTSLMTNTAMINTELQYYLHLLYNAIFCAYLWLFYFFFQTL